MGAGASPVSQDKARWRRNALRATASTVPLLGAGLTSYRALEVRLAAQAEGWSIALVPSQQALPAIDFAAASDQLEGEAREAAATAARAARRWNLPALLVPGFAAEPAENPCPAERRAAAVAALLQEQGIAALRAPSTGNRLVLHTEIQP